MAAALELTGAASTTSVPRVLALKQRNHGPLLEICAFKASSRRAKNDALDAQVAISPEETQEVLWKQFFADTSQWRDNRRSKPTSRHPDFRHKESKIPLWLNNRHKPAWVDSQLAAMDASSKTTFGTGCSLEASVSTEDRLELEMCRKLCEEGLISEAVDSLDLLVQRGCNVPNNLFYRVLKRCMKEKHMALGRRIHDLTVRNGYKGDSFLATHLICFYASLGRLEEAMAVFTEVSTPDAYNWATIISAYARHGSPAEAAEAIRLYRQMCESTTVIPDDRLFSAVLIACAAAKDLVAGKEVHARMVGLSGNPNQFLQAGLVNMYAKCGGLEDARQLFDKLSDKDVVTWNAMIAGYAQQGMSQEAVDLYRSMVKEGLTRPTTVTYVCLLQACAAVAALPLGEQLHKEIEGKGMQADSIVGSALVNMYSKCGSMFDAQRVFDSLSTRDIEAWGALISGYARQGDSQVVFELLDRMRLTGVQPDEITFLSVLTVCSHLGLVDKGREYFQAMATQYGISTTMEHYICMVDLLGRAGHLDEALRMVKTVPFPPSDVLWHTLLGACQKWKNVEIGQEAFQGAVGVDESNAVSYVLMSNIYASNQMLEAAKEMQARRMRLGAWKKPGQSWWTDISGVVHTFRIGDKKHPESESIYARLRELLPKMKKDMSPTWHHRC